MTDILIVAPAFLDWDLGTYISKILVEKGIDHARFEYRDFDNHVEANRALLAKAADIRPRIILGLKLGVIEPQTIRALRVGGSTVGLWYVDCFDGRVPPEIGRLVPEVDAFFVTARGMVPHYQALGGTPVHWIVEGVHLPSFPEADVPAAQRPLYHSEVAFVGNLLQPPVEDLALARRRFHLLSAVCERFDLKIWGPQGDTRAASVWGDRCPIIRWPAYNEELVKICQSSDIMLGINTINTVPLYFSNRTYLTLASGGFHLTHYVPELEKMFTNGEHLVWYHDDGECLDLIDHYLQRPEERRRIAAAGRTWVQERYGMDRQVMKMIDILEGIQSLPAQRSNRKKDA
jgi:Glycosyl transferases group 1